MFSRGPEMLEFGRGEREKIEGVEWKYRCQYIYSNKQDGETVDG